MAVGITSIHKRRIITQIEQNLVGLQRDMVSNASTHRAMAVAQAPDVTALAAMVRDCALEYLRRLQWVVDLRSDPVKRQRLLDMLVSVGWSEQEIIDLVQDLRQAAIALRDAPRASYAQIVAACDAVLATVDLPPSLWPE